MRITLLIVAALLGSTFPRDGAQPPDGAPPATPDAPPVSVFAALDGTWTGTFVGYDTEGVELYRIRARHTYRTVDDTTQSVTITDTMADGTTITGTGTNTAHRRRDGTLVLRCLVSKSNGDRIDHQGRLVKGPQGDTQIVWFSRAADPTQSSQPPTTPRRSGPPARVETFREVVKQEGEATVYEINGLGRYGDTLILMTGRYWKQEGTKARSHGVTK